MILWIIFFDDRRNLFANGAGLGTGFAGMSAAAVISPMLITFLGIEPYTAVGITCLGCACQRRFGLYLQEK